MGNSLAVQWLGLRASTAGGMGLIPGLGINIPHATRPKNKNKNKKKEGRESKERVEIEFKTKANNRFP